MIDNLRVTAAFPDEETAEQHRQIHSDGAGKRVPGLTASELYEPLDAFRNLGLRVIDWRGKDGKLNWKPNSEEGTPLVIGINTS